MKLIHRLYPGECPYCLKPDGSSLGSSARNCTDAISRTSSNREICTMTPEMREVTV